MSRRWNNATIAVSMAALTAAPTFAQGTPEAPKPQESKPAATGDKHAANDDLDVREGRVRRVTKLLACEVKNTRGENIGEIEALIIDRNEGCVAYAVISFGGLMGFGEKLFALPFTRIVRTEDPTCVVADVTKLSLEKAPAFESDNWPAFDRKYGTTLHEYYKESPYWDDPTRPSHQDPTRMSKAALGKDALSARGMVRSSKFIGTAVEDTGGKSIGEIDDVVIDDGNGRILYAVLSFGGIFGVGDKRFAIPWQALASSTRSDDALVLDVAKERLAAAPGFDKEKWPDMADRRWGSDIHEYYDQRPYWSAPSEKSGEPPSHR